MVSRRGAFAVFIALTTAVVAIDQATKWLALEYLAPHEPYPLTAFLNLTLVYNRGAAFGFLNQASGWQLAVFSLIAVFVVAYVTHHIYREAWRSTPTVFAYALIGGGALGNLADRLRFGHVVDFIDFYLGGWHFWVFNLADSALTVGVIVLLLVAAAEFRAHRQAHAERDGRPR